MSYQIFSKTSCSTFLVDQSDAANVLEAYIAYVTPTDEDSFFTETGSLYVDYILQDDFLKQPDLISDFVQATLLRLWYECLFEDKSMIGHFIEYSTGIFTAYGKAFHLHSGKTANSMAETLCSGDFVELVGRIVLCPFACKSDLMGYIKKGTDDHFALVTLTRWDELLRGTTSIVKQYSAVEEDKTMAARILD
ncbi:hypothetical protein RhiJN_27395 [Ceratobasidium sp. AG-Ba]|nr:hypothetical protein RhiJN_13324 [Ceratobasidium sp. AG-Ba]QRV99376.1 hypothetical protein RhiJN_27395 [Ceratobasidium sp. AG-Ba]QRW13881.1 hypothetical protein RhiLY_12880 [Ceratobasidium sp. AG-Ba]